MTAVATVGGLLVIGGVPACGDTDPYPVASGLYQLSTAQVDGDCSSTGRCARGR